MASNEMIVDPYNEPAVTDCIEASGYQFRKNTLPTVAQYRIMCHNSPCMEVANAFLLSGKDLPSFDPNAKPILQGFVYPMIDFCYFHHVPTDPCPTDFLSQFFADMKALVDTCEKKSGFSFADLPPKVSYDGDNQKLLKVLCDVDECDNLMKRLHVKYFVETCQPFRVLDTAHNYFVLPADFQAVWSKLVMPYVSECEVGRNDAPENPRWNIPYYFRGTEFTFIEMPGPLPGDLAPATTPPPTTVPPPATNTSLHPSLPVTSSPPSPPSTSKPAPTLVTAPPKLAPGSPVLDTSSTSSPTSEPSTTTTVVISDKVGQATTKPPTSSTLIRPLQTTSPVPVVVPVASEASSPSGSGSGVAGPRAVTRGSKSPLAIPPAQTRRSLPRPTEAPVISDVPNQTSNSRSYSLLWGVGIGVGATVLVLLIFLFILRRTRKVQKPGNGYVSFDGTETSSESAPPQHTDLVPCREIPVHQLSDIRIIGGGGFGVVYLVRYTGDKTSPDRNLLASKRINKENYSKDQLDAFIAEINLAATLSHPRIVEFVGVAGLRKAELQALFEYMAGGDLKRYLDSQPPTNPAHHSWTPEKLQIAIDIADALAYLHTRTPKPVVHRDLKSRNVMLTSDRRAKLGDFGVSRTESAAGSMTTGVGTSRWVAPEVILGGGDYTTACDVYSFGVVLSELDTHRLPFSDLVQANGEQLADFVLLPMVATERKQPSFSETCPLSILTLARSCLAYEATDRPTAVDVAETLRVVQREFGRVSPVKS